MTILEALRSVTTEIKAWVTKRLEGYISTSQVGAANGVAGLDANKQVAAANLPFATTSKYGVTMLSSSTASTSNSTAATSYAVNQVRLEAKEMAVKDWDQSDPTKSDYIKNRPFYRSLEAIKPGDKVIEYLTKAYSPSDIYDPTIGEFGDWEEIPDLYDDQYVVNIQIDSTTTKRILCQATNDNYYYDDDWEDSGASNEYWSFRLSGDGVVITLDYEETYYDYNGNRSMFGRISHDYDKVEKIEIYEYTGEAEYRITPIDEEYLPESIYALASTTTDGRMSASDKAKLDGIAEGATASTGTITKVQANGTDVASSGTANIPAASTTVYGVTKLSSATDSTSTALAATASAVKAAYDLAASKTANTGTITKVQANGTDVASSGTANIPAASTSVYGVTKLSSATNSTSTALAATASAVKSAYDLAAAAMPKSGGTFTAAAKAHVGTDYTTCRLRNAKIDTSTSPSLSNGEIAFVYS